MSDMTDDDIRAFMRSGSRTGKLATVRSDGSPHVVPVWFDFDDDTGDAVFVTGARTVKARNIKRDPRVSICVDEEVMPFSFARLDGQAAITAYESDPELVLHWATYTCRRYVGDSRAEEYGRRNAVAGEAMVRVRPTRMTGELNLAE